MANPPIPDPNATPGILAARPASMNANQNVVDPTAAANANSDASKAAGYTVTPGFTYQNGVYTPSTASSGLPRVPFTEQNPPDGSKPNPTDEPTTLPPGGSTSGGSSAPITSSYTGGSAVDQAILNPNAPSSEADDYAALVKQSGGLIDSINASYKDEIDSANAASAARTNAAGLAGSSAGGDIYNEAQKPIIDKRNQDVAAAYSNIETMAQNQREFDVGQYSTDLQNALSLEQANTATAKASIATLAANHTNLADYKNSDPAGYASLVQALGGDSNVVDALWATSVPAPDVTQSWTTSDGNGGTTINQLVQDPITKKPSYQSFNIPNVTIPKNQSVISKGSGTGGNWFTTGDPNDPSTFKTYTINPETGITTVSSPTTQAPGDASSGSVNGITLDQNGIPQTPTDSTGLSTLSSALSSVESGANAGVPGSGYKAVNASTGALGKYQIVPKDWFSSIGLNPDDPQDIQKFLNSPALQDQAFGTVISTISKQYNGDLGKTLGAYFGGDAGASAYGTTAGDKMSDGNMSVNQYVNTILGNMGIDQKSLNQSTINSNLASDDTVTSTAQQLVSGLQAPSMLSKRSTGIDSYNNIMKEANKLSLTQTGKPFNAEQAENQYDFANAIGTQSTQVALTYTVSTLKDIKDLSTKVDRDNITYGNQAGEWLQYKGSDPDTVAFITKANGAIDDVSAALGGGVSTDTKTEIARSIIDPSLSQTAFAKQIDTDLSTITARQNAINTQAGQSTTDSSSSQNADTSSDAGAEIMSAGGTSNGDGTYTMPDGTVVTP